MATKHHQNIGDTERDDNIEIRISVLQCKSIDNTPVMCNEAGTKMEEERR